MTDRTADGEAGGGVPPARGSAMSVSDAVGLNARGLADWIASSDTVFALELNRGGAFVARNQAGQRFFAKAGDSIADFLTAADANSLLARLGGGEREPQAFLLNIAAGEKNPESAEAVLLPADGVYLLVGVLEQRHVVRLHDEMLHLSNELALAVRQLGQRVRDLEQANQTIARMARTDELTGLGNRRAFSEELAAEIDRAQRHGSPLALLMGDIDGFKGINDLYGHVVGDHVLAEVGGVICEGGRAYDAVSRYGGDEFAMLLPETGLAAAAEVAQRICASVERLNLEGVPGQIRMTLGVTVYCTGESEQVFIGRADMALCEAKLAGRNRVGIADPSQKDAHIESAAIGTE